MKRFQVAAIFGVSFILLALSMVFIFRSKPIEPVQYPLDPPFDEFPYEFTTLSEIGLNPELTLDSSLYYSIDPIIVKEVGSDSILYVYHPIGIGIDSTIYGYGTKETLERLISETKYIYHSKRKHFGEDEFRGAKNSIESDKEEITKFCRHPVQYAKNYFTDIKSILVLVSLKFKAIIGTEDTMVQSIMDLKDAYMTFEKDSISVENHFDYDSRVFGEQTDTVLQQEIYGKLRGAVIKEAAITLTLAGIVSWMSKERTFRRFVDVTNAIKEASANKKIKNALTFARLQLLLRSKWETTSLNYSKNLMSPLHLKKYHHRPSAGQFFNRTMAYIHVEEIKGRKSEDVINDLAKYNPEVIGPEVRKNYQEAKDLGVFTKDNLNRMRKGNSPISSKGEHLEVDHTLPFSKCPSLAMNLSNLRYLPARANRIKSDDFDEASNSLLKAFKDHGMVNACLGR